MVPSGEFAGVRVSRRDRWRGGDASSRLDDGSTVGGGDSTKKGKGKRALPRGERARTEFPGTSDEPTLHSEVRAGRIARDNVREPREGARESDLHHNGLGLF